MRARPKLTVNQKTRLKVLEPLLRSAAKSGDYERAKQVTHEIQELLRPTGHETRLMQAKIWFFETAMEAGNMEIAIAGLIGVRKKTSPTTRLYLEATATLAICYLRKGNPIQAAPLVDETMKSIKNVSSDRQQRKLRAALTKRFEEEGLLAALSNVSPEVLDPARIHSDATALARTKTQDEIFALLGGTVSPEVLRFLERIKEVSRKQLPYKEILLLSGAQLDEKNLKIGDRVFASVKRVVWKSLCDPKSDVYKMWYTSGVSAVFDKKYLTGAIVASLSGFRIGGYAIALYTSALVIKMGLEVFCDVYHPAPVMESRDRN